MKVRTDELRVGDIITTAYGDYNNIVTVEIESITKEDDGWTHIIGQYLDFEGKADMYTFGNCFENVISRKEQT